MPRDIPTLNIVTPVSRLQNLPAIYKNIRSTICGNVRWFTVFDPRHASVILDWQEKLRQLAESGRFPSNATRVEVTVGGREGGWGGSKRTYALERIESGWCYFLDDDNLMHPDFTDTFLEGISESPAAQVLVFQQANKDGALRMRASQTHVQFGHIDTGQFVIDRALLGTAAPGDGAECLVDWGDDYCSDRKFIERIWKISPEVFHFVPRVATYYNALRECEINGGGWIDPKSEPPKAMPC